MDKSHSPSYVIAVSSVSGGGKTTLVKRSAELLKASTLFFDDYASVSTYPSDMKKWVMDGADVNEWKTPQFAQDLATLKSGVRIVSPKGGDSISPAEFIVIEEPMGRKRAEMASLIDFVAVIDTPLEIALSRRLLRDTGHILSAVNQQTEQDTQTVHRIIGYVQGYLNDYLNAGRDLYIAVQEQAKENCDLILDGTLSVDELAQQLVATVRSKPNL
jgi:uridine kinase